MITEGRYRANRAFLAVSAHLSPLRLLSWVPYTYSVSGICLQTSHRHIIEDMPPPSPPSQLSLFTMPSARGGGLLESALYCPL